MKDGSNRRKFLKTGLAGLAAGIAGCTGQQDGGGGGGGTEADSTPTPRVETKVVEKTRVVEETVTIEQTPTPEQGVEYEVFPKQNWLAQSRTNNPQNYEWGILAKRNLERLGIRFNWDVVESGAWADRLFGRDWDFTHLAWSGSPERIFPYYNLYFSFHSQFAEVGEGNFELWSSSEYDTAVENFIASIDDQKRKEWAQRCQEIIGYNMPVNFGVHPSALVAASTNNFGNWKPMFGTFAFYNHNTLRDVESKGDKDTLVYATTRPWNVFPNFWGVTGPDMLMGHNMYYDALFYSGYKGQPYPMAADPDDPFEWNNDTTLTVNLRDGMTFHDGEDVTSADVKFTWDWLLDHGVPYLGSDIGAVESVEAPDDSTVVFNLTRPFSGFVQVSLFRVKILPQHVWEPAMEEHDVTHPRELRVGDQVAPTGSGPFKFVQYEPQQRFIVEKNPDHYWSGQYDFNTLIKQTYSNQSAMVGDMIDGKVDCTQFLAATHFERADKAQSVKAVANDNLYTTGIWVLDNQNPWTDVLVRRAMGHAVNDQAIINFVFRGHGEEARSPVAPVNEFYYDPETPHYKTNLQRARDLLAESGFRWDERGRLMMPADWEPTLTFVEPEEPDEYIIGDQAVEPVVQG